MKEEITLFFSTKILDTAVLSPSTLYIGGDTLFYCVYHHLTAPDFINSETNHPKKACFNESVLMCD